MIANSASHADCGASRSRIGTPSVCTAWIARSGNFNASGATATPIHASPATYPPSPRVAAGMHARNVPAKTTSVVILMPYARVGFGSDAMTVRQMLAMIALDPPRALVP